MVDYSGMTDRSKPTAKPDRARPVPQMVPVEKAALNQAVTGVRGQASADGPLLILRADLNELVKELRSVGVPLKLLTSIDRKCLKTPRRQTGRVDYRTNRAYRWNVPESHPDYSTELNARLVLLRLLLDAMKMRHAPTANQALVARVTSRYFPNAPIAEVTRDPLTDEVLDWNELVQDIVEKPKHGYSRFHIGHQDPRSHPKHMPGNVRWQLKASNDFQDGMDIRVARIAFSIDLLTRTRDAALVRVVTDALVSLCKDLGVVNPLDVKPTD